MYHLTSDKSNKTLFFQKLSVRLFYVEFHCYNCFVNVSYLQPSQPVGYSKHSTLSTSADDFKIRWSIHLGRPRLSSSVVASCKCDYKLDNSWRHLQTDGGWCGWSGSLSSWCVQEIWTIFVESWINFIHSSKNSVTQGAQQHDLHHQKIMLKLIVASSHPATFKIHPGTWMSNGGTRCFICR